LISLEDYAYFVALVDQVEGAQGATGVLGGVQQGAVDDGELVVVSGALDDALVEGGDIEGMLAMGAVGLYQVEFPPPLEQQQLEIVDLELAAVVVVEIDQLFQGIKSHDLLRLPP
jgi:hypothetical protein